MMVLTVDTAYAPNEQHQTRLAAPCSRCGEPVEFFVTAEDTRTIAGALLASADRLPPTKHFPPAGGDQGMAA